MYSFIIAGIAEAANEVDTNPTAFPFFQRERNVRNWCNSRVKVRAFICYDQCDLRVPFHKFDVNQTFFLAISMLNNISKEFIEY